MLLNGRVRTIKHQHNFPYSSDEVDTGGRKDAIIIDFQKVFNIAPHNLVIKRMLILWAQEMLSGRTT